MSDWNFLGTGYSVIKRDTQPPEDPQCSGVARGGRVRNNRNSAEKIHVEDICGGEWQDAPANVQHPQPESGTTTSSEPGMFASPGPVEIFLAGGEVGQD